MADKSKIEWTDATWNPIRGCSRVSEGCRNCYAERTAARFAGSGQPYEGLVKIIDRTTCAPGQPKHSFVPTWTGEVRFIPELLQQPLRWRRPRKIFVNSMSDLFHEKVSADVVYKIFMVMWAARQHTFQILTKRPERMRKLVQTWLDVDSELMRKFAPDALPGGGGIERCGSDLPLSNVWFGVSVEDQKTADQRIPLLLQTPAAVRWVSYEPALGPVDFSQWLSSSGTIDPETMKWESDRRGRLQRDLPGLDWLVAGGESGPNARPAHPDWIRTARDQCRAAGVPFFFKQWGEWLPIDHFPKNENGDPVDPAHPRRMYHGMDLYATEKCGFARLVRVGKEFAGAVLDGEIWKQFPVPGVRA